MQNVLDGVAPQACICAGAHNSLTVGLSAIITLNEENSLNHAAVLR
jgi:hypothetical protein